MLFITRLLANEMSILKQNVVFQSEQELKITNLMEILARKIV